MVDEITRASLLYDFYGNLLTEKQRHVMELYHEENLSLSEIADEFGISRQGVYDALKKAEQSLSDYEKKLGLVNQFITTRETIGKIENQITEIITELGSKSKEDIIKKLENVKTIINELD